VNRIEAIEMAAALENTRDQDLDAIAVSRLERTIVLNNGTCVPFGILFDGQNETHDAVTATAVVAQMADGRWIVVDLTAFEDAPLIHGGD
jgi:hypothetical protein